MSQELALQPQPEIDLPYPLSSAQIATFREQGYLKLKQVLSAEVLAFYGAEFTRVVKASNRNQVPLEQRDTYGKAFIQITNLWRRSELARAFVFGKRLARIAAELLGVEGVRIWHDQALYKEPSGGFTPWHADQYYWPMASEKSITAWIPLQATPLEMGPLAFAAGSQRVDFGRNLQISDASEVEIQRRFGASGLRMVEEPFELGEVSFHYGWTFHRAGPNGSARPREVMTVIYMDQEMRLAQPANKAQQHDWDSWCPGTRVGEVMRTDLNPVVYSGLKVAGRQG